MVVAASELYPGKNNVVIGLGTAVTYNFINKKRGVPGWRHIAGNGNAV